MDSQTFSQNYGQLVARTWADPEYLDALKENPAEVLADAGIETQDDATIHVVVVEPTGEGDVERQIEDWEKGAETGTYYLWVPMKPDDISGDVEADDVSTTCTPCTTCT